jgi:hypothetical protein
MSARAPIFGEDEPALDVSAFTPRPRPAPDAGAVRTVSEASEFFSRQPAAPAPRRDRRRRTGRNRQINIKATEETIEALYRLCDRQGWVLGEALERAVAALEAMHGEAGDGASAGADPRPPARR